MRNQSKAGLWRRINGVLHGFLGGVTSVSSVTSGNYIYAHTRAHVSHGADDTQDSGDTCGVLNRLVIMAGSYLTAAVAALTERFLQLRAIDSNSMARR